jgi:hypothetical protein
MRLLSCQSVGVVALAMVPGVVAAQDPAIPINLDPSTVVWFFGCVAGLPDACMKAGVGREPGTRPYPWTLFYGSGVFPSFDVDDAWTWQLIDGSCRRKDQIIMWADTDCFIAHIESAELIGRGFFYQKSELGFLDRHSASITLIPLTDTPLGTTEQSSVAPEPGSLALLATGVAGVGVGIARRRRKATPR